MNLKNIDFTKSTFEANGHRYTIEETMSIERYALYQRFEIEAGYGTSFKELFAALAEAYKLLNGQKFADAAVMIYNSMKGMSELDRKEPYVLRYCALVCNRDGEDRRTITEEQISEKIKDWQEEGIAVSDFFSLALRSIPGFISTWRKNSPLISNGEEADQGQLQS
jgi:hypothetical protein